MFSGVEVPEGDGAVVETVDYFVARTQGEDVVDVDLLGVFRALVVEREHLLLAILTDSLLLSSTRRQPLPHDGAHGGPCHQTRPLLLPLCSYLQDLKGMRVTGEHIRFQQGLQVGSVRDDLLDGGQVEEKV